MTVMSSALNSALTKGMIALAGAGTYATATGAVLEGAALGVFGGLTGGLSLMGGTALSETMATYVLGAGIAIAVLGTSYGHVKAFQWALNTIPKQL